MMNKGLEVIEAARLFGVDESRIGVLVHPQSVVHGLVCYQDGSILAQLGSPDMRIPIAYALAWPARMATNSPRLDLAQLATLQFSEPDVERFPALRVARNALRDGGAAPTILNAANEVAVAAFLAGRIGFLDIVDMVERALERVGAVTVATLGDVLAVDAHSRRVAEDLAAVLAE
jgi:1-deoxy-D-xylulose-5-phosphate reductoisomerase